MTAEQRAEVYYHLDAGDEAAAIQAASIVREDEYYEDVRAEAEAANIREVFAIIAALWAAGKRNTA